MMPRCPVCDTKGCDVDHTREAVQRLLTCQHQGEEVFAITMPAITGSAAAYCKGCGATRVHGMWFESRLVDELSRVASS